MIPPQQQHNEEQGERNGASLSAHSATPVLPGAHSIAAAAGTAMARRQTCFVAPRLQDPRDRASNVG